MAVNKVVINTENGAETIVDLTGDTVTPQTLAEGAVAHDASGNAIKGAMPTTSVLYTQQTLTNEQRTQARYNIDALGASDVVNNLETFSPERPLSAEQGVALANSINAASEQLLNEIEILADHKADKSTVTEEINTAIKKIPVGDGTTAGITKVYPSAECTTYTSETGTCTPAAVKKAVTQFGFPASGGNITGHIYLTGSKPSSSTGNTTQVVFGTSSEQHLALSSNTGMLVLNPNTSTTTGQILLKLGGASSFPKGIQAGGVSPMSNNGSNLGTTSLKWNNVYATTFNGSLSGNATSATKATQDGNGNTITSTYETKADAVARSSQLSAKINEITPVRGEDYWTEEDVENILGEANTLIADEMAKKDQLKPEFANSIEECTDPDKLYVLLDN